MFPPDYHMHTPLCRHAEGSPTEYAAAAKRAGLTEIGFTDHSPMERDDFDDWRMLESELDAYVASVEQARRDHPDLDIRLSLEVDYLPEQEDWIQSLAQRHPWDYLLGSVHYIAGPWDIDNPHKLDQWKSRDPWDVWSEYFDRLTRAAASALFDVIGHADLPKKFCFYPDRDVTPLYEVFLDAASSTGTAFELNTAGLRKDCREIYPNRTLVEMGFRKNVPITFGSDAHAPGDVGRDFDAAVALARDAGYTSTIRFKEGKQETVSLPEPDRS